MPEQADELDPLSPSALEVGLSVLCLLHVGLVALVLFRLVRGTAAVPHGVLGLAVLLFVPVVGPMLVLSWQRVHGSPSHSVS